MATLFQRWTLYQPDGTSAPIKEGHALHKTVPPSPFLARG